VLQLDSFATNLLFKCSCNSLKGILKGKCELGQRKELPLHFGKMYLVLSSLFTLIAFLLIFDILVM
jgi:hypothetical protein